jgi:hypothetical protein
VAAVQTQTRSGGRRTRRTATGTVRRRTRSRHRRGWHRLGGALGGRVGRGSGCTLAGRRAAGAAGAATRTALAAIDALLALTGAAGALALATAGGSARVAAASGLRQAVALAGLAEVLEGLCPEALTGALRARQAPGGGLRDVEVGVDPRRGGVRLRRVGEAQVECLVDQLPPGDVVPVDERDRDTGAAGPAGAADPVHVGLLVLGALVVHDVADAGDVDATGGDVGGDQDVHLAAAKGPQSLLAGALAEVTVDGGRGEPTVDELVGNLLRGALGAAEDHHQAAVARLQHAGEQLRLVQVVGPVDELRRQRNRRALVVAVGADVGRLGHERPGQRHDRAGHRRGEQHRLPLVRDHREDALDVGQEAQVEHLVGLVEDENLDLAEDQVALLGEVQQPARGADDDLDACLQRLDLRLERAAAVDGLHADAALGAGRAQIAGDLHAQLTGGDDDQRLRHAVTALGRRADPLQHRDAEAEGLAGAGARLTDEVVAGQRQREGQLLDGEGAGDPDLGQGGDDVGVQVEVAEQRAVAGDGGAAQLLDLRLELLRRGGAGFGVLEGDGFGRWCFGRFGGRGGVLGGRQCSRLWSAGGTGSGGGDPLRRTCPGSVVAGSVPAPTRPADRASGARETALRGVVQRLSAHRYTVRPEAHRFPW